MAGEATEANGASGGDLRSAILSELSDTGPDADAPVEAAADDSDEETASQDEAVDEEVEAAGDDGAEAEATSDDEDEQAETDEEVEADADPKVAKGLDQVRRAEKHARAKLEAERAEIAAEREQHKQALAEVEQVKTLAAKAKYDPVAVLRALGLSDDDFELAAHAIFAESKAGAADPNRKAAAAARLREREKEDKLSATDKRIAELEAQIKADKAEAAAAQEAAVYLAELNQHIARDPLVAQAMKADPELTTVGLQAAFDRLQKNGIVAPKPKQIVAEYEKRERIRLEKLGVDVSKFAKPAAKVAAKPGASPVVAGKAPANTNGAKKAIPSRDEMIAELSKLKS